MLKAIVNYSKKVPVPNAEFSSQGYSLSLEVEIPETEASAIQRKLSETFHLVRDQVEQELANASGSVRTIKAVEPEGHPAESEDKPRARSGVTGDKASNKQLKFLTDLATQRGMSLSDLNADVQHRFNVGGIYDLTRRDASQLLDELSGKQRKAA